MNPPYTANGSNFSLSTWVEDADGNRICTMKRCERDWENACNIASALNALAEKNGSARVAPK